MQVNLMGTLEVFGGGCAITPTAPKPRQVLALLAVDAGALVGAEQLIDELWPEGPPVSAKTTVQTYIYHLRKALARGGPGREVLETRPAGYVLAIPREAVDVFRFQDLVADGRGALRGGEPSRAAELLREALGLWRGPMLADVPCGPRLGGHATYVEEQRMEALSLRIDADLEACRHRELVSELRWLVTTHRLHEWIYVRLMQALHHSGRRGDALAVYQQLRGTLEEELGLEPSVEAKRIQYEILSA